MKIDMYDDNKLYRYNVISRIIAFSNKRELYFEFLKRYNGKLLRKKKKVNFLSLNKNTLYLLGKHNYKYNDYFFYLSSSFFKYNKFYCNLFSYKWNKLDLSNDFSISPNLLINYNQVKLRFNGYFWVLNKLINLNKLYFINLFNTLSIYNESYYNIYYNKIYLDIKKDIRNSIYNYALFKHNYKYYFLYKRRNRKFYKLYNYKYYKYFNKFNKYYKFNKINNIYSNIKFIRKFKNFINFVSDTKFEKDKFKKFNKNNKFKKFANNSNFERWRPKWFKSKWHSYNKYRILNKSFEYIRKYIKYYNFYNNKKILKINKVEYQDDCLNYSNSYKILYNINLNKLSSNYIKKYDIWSKDKYVYNYFKYIYSYFNFIIYKNNIKSNNTTESIFIYLKDMIFKYKNMFFKLMKNNVNINIIKNTFLLKLSKEKETKYDTLLNTFYYYIYNKLDYYRKNKPTDEFLFRYYTKEEFHSYIWPAEGAKYSEAYLAFLFDYKLDIDLNSFIKKLKKNIIIIRLISWKLINIYKICHDFYKNILLFNQNLLIRFIIRRIWNLKQYFKRLYKKMSVLNIINMDTIYIDKLHSIKNTPNIVLINVYRDIFCDFDIKIQYILDFWNILEFLKIPLKMNFVKYYQKRKLYLERLNILREQEIKKRLDFLENLRIRASKNSRISNAFEKEKE